MLPLSNSINKYSVKRSETVKFQAFFCYRKFKQKNFVNIDKICILLREKILFSKTDSPYD